MQIYDKKLLEQQVKALLKEQASNCAPKDNGMTGPMVKEMLVDMFFGMKSSRDQLWHIVDLVGHGMWSEESRTKSHLTYAASSVEGIGPFESFLLPFLKMKASEGGEATGGLVWNNTILEAIYDARDEAAKSMAEALLSKKAKRAGAIYKDFIQNKIFREIFDKYGISDENPDYSKIFRFPYVRPKYSTTFRPNNDWVSAELETLAGQYNNGVDQDGDKVNSLSVGELTDYLIPWLEESICKTSYALWWGKNHKKEQVKSFQQMCRLATTSNLPALSSASAFAVWSEQQTDVYEALVSFADVASSWASLIAVGGIALAAARALGLASVGTKLWFKTAMTGTGRALASGPAKFALFVTDVLAQGEKYGETLEVQLPRLEEALKTYESILKTSEYSPENFNNLGNFADKFRVFKRTTGAMLTTLGRMANSKEENEDLYKKDAAELQAREAQKKKLYKGARLEALELLRFRIGECLRLIHREIITYRKVNYKLAAKSTWTKNISKTDTETFEKSIQEIQRLLKESETDTSKYDLAKQNILLKQNAFSAVLNDIECAKKDIQEAKKESEKLDKVENFLGQNKSNINSSAQNSLAPPSIVDSRTAVAKSVKADTGQANTTSSDIIIIGDSNAFNLVYYLSGNNSHSKHVTKSGAQTGAIYNLVVKYFEENFPTVSEDTRKIPKTAIIHMGYNGPTTAMPGIVNTIEFLQKKGISDIRVINVKVGDKPKLKNPEGYKKSIRALNSKIAGLQGVTIINNDAESNVGGDQFHFSVDGYKALLGSTMGASSESPGQTDTKIQDTPGKERPIPGKEKPTGIKGTSVTAKNIQQNFGSEEAAGAPLDDIIRKAFYRESAKMGLTPEDFDKYCKAVAKLESGGDAGKESRYTNHVGGYFGKYQIGSENYYRAELSRVKSEYNIPDSIIPSGNISYQERKDVLSKQEYLNFMKSRKGYQIQELMFARFQSKNYSEWIRGAKDLKQVDRIGMAALAHNAGGPAAGGYLIHRKNYIKTKDTKFLMKMWGVQDGNAFPSENFYRAAVNSIYGSTFSRLPKGDLSLYKKHGGHGAFGKNGDKHWVELYGQQDISSYYSDFGTPSGKMPEADAAVKPLSADPDEKTSKKQNNKVVVDTDFVRKLESRTTEISGLDDFEDLIIKMSELYGSDRIIVTNRVGEVRQYASELNTSTLSGYRNQKFTELTKMVHQTNRELFFSFYKSQRKEDEALANKIMALLHRPRMVTRVTTSFLLYNTVDTFTLSFEMGPPYGDKVGINDQNWPLMSAAAFGDSAVKAKLMGIFTKNKQTFEALRDRLMSFEQGQIEVDNLTDDDKRIYLDWLNSYISLFEAGLDSLIDSGSSIRRSWNLDNLSAAIYLLS